MSDKVFDIPAIAQSVDPAIRIPVTRMREAIQTLMGTIGDGSNAAYTARRGGGSAPSSPGIIVVGSDGPAADADLTPPPNVVNLRATAGFGQVIVEWDPAVYTQGHGPKQTNLYAVKRTSPETGSAPTFGDAQLADTAMDALTIASLSSDLGVTWHLWAKFETVDGVESISPAGGVNGVVVTTGKIGNSDLGPLIVDAGNLADGSVSGTKLADAAFGLTKFAAGIEPVTIVTSGPLPTVKSTSTIFWGGKLYRWTGSAYVASVAAADIAGQVQDAQVAGLAASKVTGQLTDEQLASVSAAKLIGQVGNSQIAQGAVQALQLGAGAVTASKLAAGSVTASALLVTDLENLCTNPNALVDLSGWMGGSCIRGTTGAFSAGSVTFIRQNQRDNEFGQLIPVNPGDQFFCSMDTQVYGGGTSNGTSAYDLSLGFEVFNLTPTLIDYVRVAIRPAAAVGIVSISGAYTVPAGVYFLRIWVQQDGDGNTGFTSATTEVYFRNVQVRRKNNGNLIVDGAITANKIAAQAITAAQIAAGTITAGQIAAETITAAQIAAGTVTAAKIAAGTIQAINIAAGTITGDKIAGATITGANIVGDSITAGQIAAGAIGVSELAAGAVTAKSLVVSDFQNLCFNGMGFSLDGWCVSAGVQTGDNSGIAAMAAGATFWPESMKTRSALIFARRDSFFGPVIDGVRQGDQFLVSFDSIPSGAGAAVRPFGVGLVVFDQNGGIVDYQVMAQRPAGSAGAISLSAYSAIRAPGAARAQVWAQVENGGGGDPGDFSSNGTWFYATNIRVLRRNAGQLIVDGAITANHLAANSIAVGSAAIQDGAIRNALIANAAIDDAKVANLSAAKLTVGDGTIGGNLKSANYAGGSTGWLVRPDGYAEFSNIVIRNSVYVGTIYAAAGTIAGITIGSTDMRSGNYVPGTTGTRINADGSAEFNNITIRGSIRGGAFTGYSWPGAGAGGGVYLGPGGLLLGSANDGRYFQVEANGNIYAPGLSIVNGSANFAGSLSAATGTFAGALSAATGTFAGSVSAASLTLGDGTIGGQLKSANYAGGSTGWVLRPDGSAEFSNVVVRGTIYAAAGTIAGITVGGADMRSGNYVPGTAGSRINADGSAEFNNLTARGNIVANALNAATGSYTGALVGATGSFAGSLTTPCVYTENIVGAAISTTYSATSGGTSTSVTVTVPSGAQSVSVMAFFGSNRFQMVYSPPDTGEGGSQAHPITISEPAEGSISSGLGSNSGSGSTGFSVPNPSAGTFTFTATRATRDPGTGYTPALFGNITIIAILTKR